MDAKPSRRRGLPDRFDRSRLRVLPLADREHKLALDVKQVPTPVETTTPELREVAQAMLRSRSRGASRTPRWVSRSDSHPPISAPPGPNTR